MNDNLFSKELALQAKVREMPLHFRLDECRKRIGRICAEGRSLKMSIPVQADDDDFFISTTLTDAIHEIFSNIRHTFRKAEAKNKEHIYVFTHTPGHGFLEVPKSDMIFLDVARDHEFSYFYDRGTTIELEEDEDAPHFLKKAKAAGWNVKIIHKTLINPDDEEVFYHRGRLDP